MRYRNIANIDADSTKAAIEAPQNAGLRNSERSRIGWRTRRSISTKTTSSTAAPARQARIAALQSSALPRISPNTARNSAAENVIVPAQSSGSPCGSRDSCTRASVSAIAPMPIGRLTKKIASQPLASTSTPPTSGPIATAAPVVAPHRPIAVPRSRPW